MRIIQISDMHLPAENEDARGIDTWKNLEDVMREAALRKPDLIVFTGDVCYDEPRESIYKKFAEKLEAIPFPLRFIAGNHDDPEMIVQLRQMRNEEKFYPKEEYDKATVLYLNSYNAQLPASEYDLLEKECFVETGKPLLIFTHYPPVKMGVPTMDSRYPFEESDKIVEILEKSRRQVHIFCGHYHNERILTANKFTIYCAPSTFFQIDEKSDDFQVMSTEVGYRIIDLGEKDIRIFTRYLDRGQ